MILPEYVHAMGLIEVLDKLANGKPIEDQSLLNELEELGWVSNGVLPIPAQVLGMKLIRDSEFHVNTWFGNEHPFSVYMAFKYVDEEIKLALEVHAPYAELFEVHFGPGDDVCSETKAHMDYLTSELLKLKERNAF